jgi:diguanylate cyclase (GGDEF)-like protein
VSARGSAIGAATSNHRRRGGRLPLEVVRVDGEPVAVRVNGQEFACEEETGETAIPKNLLAGIRLSAIPDDITIKPVESIQGSVIHVQNDIGLSRFSAGSASASVEELFRRKFWDGEVGLSPYVAALREAIAEHGATSETNFQDDDDYIFLHYEVTLTEDWDVQGAAEVVEGVIGDIQKRADQLVARRPDGLLGILDRGSFDADLSHALRNAKLRVALVMADIDHFKQVNDTYGHRAGDAVLRAVAQVLVNRSPRNAVPYRYGGEELVVIITGADAQSAAQFAESVRGDVEKLSFENPALRVTVSLGVAVAPIDGIGAEALVKKADAVLYRAKHEGRNRVKTAA